MSLTNKEKQILEEKVRDCRRNPKLIDEYCNLVHSLQEKYLRIQCHALRECNGKYYCNTYFKDSK